MTIIKPDIVGRKAAYTINEVCAQTGFGRDTIYKAIKQGKLVARKCGKRTTILDDELRAYLTSLPVLGATA
jgi:excisionase family DNA binding protein